MEDKKIPSNTKIEEFFDMIKSDDYSVQINSLLPQLDINDLSLNSPHNYFDPLAIKDLIAGNNEEEKIPNKSTNIDTNDEWKESSSINNYSNISPLNQDKITKISDVSMNYQEKEKFNEQKKVTQNANLFKVTKIYELTNIDYRLTDLSAKDEITFLKRHRNKSKRRRKYNSDNIRKKIKTGFFNGFLYKKIKHILKKIKSKIKFPKFPQKFCSSAFSRDFRSIINI